MSRGGHFCQSNNLWANQHHLWWLWHFLQLDLICFSTRKALKQRDGAENRLVKLFNPFYLLLIFLFVRQGFGGILSRIPPILLNPDYRIMRNKNIYISYRNEMIMIMKFLFPCYKFRCYSRSRIFHIVRIVQGFKISTVHGLDLNCKALEDLGRPFVHYFILRLGNTLDSLPNWVSQGTCLFSTNFPVLCPQSSMTFICLGKGYVSCLWTVLWPQTREKRTD